jgi:hypothetical protein
MDDLHDPQSETSLCVIIGIFWYITHIIMSHFETVNNSSAAAQKRRSGLVGDSRVHDSIQSALSALPVLIDYIELLAR